MNRIAFLIGRRVERTRARARAARERTRVARDSVAGGEVSGAGAAAPTVGGTLAVLAHQDDDLLFASTSLARDAREGRRILTVYLTAGDDDDDEWYWRAREAGVRAAYATLLGVADRWVESTRVVVDRPIAQATLVERPDVSLLFLRLPDGGIDGAGGTRSGEASLRKLWEGRIATISTVDSTASHSLIGLLEILRALFAEFAPDRIVTLDHVGAFDDGDHSDHHAVAYLTDLARETYEAEHSFAGYRGYPIAELPSNLDTSQIAEKERVFFAYAASDYKTSSTPAASAERPEGLWLSREYEAG